MTPEAYITENQKRRSILDAPYNPYTGEGSLTERFEVSFDGLATLHLPVAMLQDEDVGTGLQSCLDHAWSIRVQCERSEVDFEEFVEAFVERRKQYDFEYWCAVDAEIKTKKGEIVPFILNRPQRIYVARLEAQRTTGFPVRIIVGKHRQWGCTTMSYTYIGWHQMVLYTGRDAWFVGRDQDGARDVIERYDVIRKSVGLTLRNYGGSDKTKQLVERDCYVAAGSVERPNAPSGRAAQFIHLFEIGKWPSNPSVSAERVAQNVGAMLPDEPGTVRIIESTGQAAVGTYFMEICRSAERGETPDEFLFVSWLDDPQYQTAVNDVDAFIESWDDELRAMWLDGATLEQLRWWQIQRTKTEYADKWRLLEEFPRTSQEMFQTGGRPVFHPPHVAVARDACRGPVRGRLEAAGATGREAFEDITFVEDERGPLSIWRFPDDDYSGLVKGRVHNRHVAGADIGPGKWEGADFNCCYVLDRAPMLFGGMPESAAEWHGHLDTDLFAWETARLAYWYNKALLGVEVNSLIEDNETRYDPSLTVLDAIMEVYANLYLREVYDSVKQQIRKKAGFHMNAQSKDMVIRSMVKALREFYEHAEEGKETNEGYVERCLEATREMDLYKVHVDGSMGATSRAERSHPKRKDDRVIARAIAIWMHTDMPRPHYAKKQERKPRPVGMAGF